MILMHFLKMMSQPKILNLGRIQRAIRITKPLLTQKTEMSKH